MPEDPNKEGVQEELHGWEDLTSQDDGRPDMGDPVEPPPEPEPTPAEPQEPPAEPPVEPPPEPAAAEPTGEPAAETPPEGEGTPPGEEPVYTLPGGKKVTQAELAADPELLNKLVTHSNQLTYFQQLAEERKTAFDQSEAERRRLLDQYTEWEMQQRMTEQQMAQPAAPPPQRPEGKVLEGVYGPHLDQLVKDGRLSEDQRNEFGGILSEYMFDHQNIHNLVGTLVQQAVQRFDGIEAQLQGEIVPDVQRRQQQEQVQLDQNVWQQVAVQPGYEPLAEPEEWQRLKLFIAEKVNASPRDHEGRPTFDPVFDAPTMAQMYDAMTGADTRAALVALKKAQEERDKQTTAMAGGETAARAGTPPIQQPSALTPEQEAMDFTDPSMSTG